MSTEKVPFCIPWITDEDKKAVSDALTSRWLTGGSQTSKFERMFAEYINVKHAVAVSNCTAALHLSLCALNIRPGDEIVVPVFTFAATANAVLYRGARPVFADIDSATLNISPMDILNRISTRTKAIIVVHYAGRPCDMDEIMEIADDHNLFVIEDCAHSLGASYMGKKTGSMGVAGCFSFYPTKNITTLEGGMITSDDDKVAEKVRLLRAHAMTKSALERERDATWFYDVVDLGYNYRLNEIQAALGISQLRRVDKANRRRILAAQYYKQCLSRVRGIGTPYAPKESHVFHLYVIRVLSEQYGLTRDELFQHLTNKGIGLGVHYTPLHLLKYYRETLGHNLGEFPIAERAYHEVLSLPLFPTITKEQIDFVSSKIREAQPCK